VNEGPFLRIGLVLDAPPLLKFQAELVARLQASDFARVVAVMYEAPRPRVRPFGLFDLYEKVDARRFLGPSHPLSKSEAKLPLGIETITAGSNLGVGGLDLDVLLRFGGAPSLDDLPRTARYGLWSVRYGEGGGDPGAEACFWEMVDESPVTAVALEVAVDETDETAVRRTLCTGYYSTRRFSLSHNRRQPYWASVELVFQSLKQLHEQGWERLERTATPAPPRSAAKGHRAAPTNLEMLRWWAPTLLDQLAQRFEPPHVHHWRIAIRVGPLLRPDGDSADLSGFRFHESPRGHYYADPFLIEREGKTWLFFEDYHYDTSLGDIACAEVLADGTLGEARTVLKRPYHLSYPCLFEEGGALFMIPEAGDSGRIELYRCTSFPERWELEQELLPLPGLDTTVFKAEGLYWMFTSIPEPHAKTRQLRLYFASQLTGPWVEHPANPISSDVRWNRGAGAIVRDGSKLFRVSQDCGRRYGYSFSFNEILTLTATEYAERPALTVGPGWREGILATHSYARCRNVEAVDAAMKIPRSSCT
jgi:hypothetical protein